MTPENARRINEENTAAMVLFARLLTREEPLFTPQEVADFAADCRLPRAEAFRLLVAAACDREDDRAFMTRYLSPALRPLDEEKYRQNPYLQMIRFPEAQEGAWRFTHLSYAPYQLFPCGHTALTQEGYEFPAIGYFESPFSYPAVLEGGREWMTVTPNEMETMAEDIAAARGDIAVCGLGLGYFAFMAAEKADVRSITIMERDPSAIALFRRHLLPQFPHREKIILRQGDAFDFLSFLPSPPPFDFVYVDLWHDVGDGLPLYLRCRRETAPLDTDRFHYWIEQDLLIFLRGLLLEEDPSLFPLPLSLLRAMAPQITLSH